ncbi:MAG: RNA polymerase sigma factor, partial [Opitutaceae bacterium]
ISPLILVEDLAELSVLDDGPETVEAACTREEIRLLADAIDMLPTRCREIVMLRRVQGLSQKEIAEKLGITSHTVEVQVHKGVKRCRDYLRANGVHGGI